MKASYFVFGTNDKVKAVSFYDSFFENSGLAKIHDEGRMTLWANEEMMFAIAEPFDGNEATNGNGTMVGFNTATDEEVEMMYQKALDLGGICDGKPGIRSGMYSAYVRDLDKNKICLFKR